MDYDRRVRQALEEVLRTPLPDATWGYLVSRGDVGRVLAGEADLEDLAAEVQRMYTAFNASLPTMPGTGEAPMLSDVDSATVPEREKALSALLAHEAGQEKVVIDFRRDALGDRLIAWDDVGGWIREKHAEGWREHQERAIPDPPAHLRRYLRPETLRFVKAGQPYVLSVDVPKVGVLRDLLGVSVILAHRYPWSEAQATVFILTGEVPQVRLVQSDIRLGRWPASCRIVMTIDPTVSPVELIEHYREVRGRVLDGRYRSLTSKHIRLATFPLEHPGHTSWQNLCELWNREMAQENPEWVFSEVEQFARDCREARKNLLSPPVRTASEGIGG